MCLHGTNCWIVRQIDVSGTNNSRKLSINIPWNSGGMCQNHAWNLLLFLLMTYLHALDHSVTVRVAKIMLLIVPPVKVTHWINLIQIWRSCL